MQTDKERIKELETILEKIKEILLNWDCECRNTVLEIIEE